MKKSVWRFLSPEGRRMPPRRSDPGQGSGPSRYPGTFLLAFREAAASLKWEVRRLRGATVECVDDKGRQQVVGLENLYRRARREERSTWPELIAGFLGSVPTEQLENPPAGLAEVADRLLVRLGQPLGKAADLEIWFQPLVEPDLGLNLVIDYPQSMSYVSRQMVDDSGQPASAWVERALANLAAQTPPDCLRLVDADSGLRHCAVGDAYDSARALLLAQLLPEATDGCFVAVPGRDDLLVLPVTAAGLAHVPMLKAVAEKNHPSAPYSISNEVYWVKDGKWHLFQIVMKGENVTVQPPQEFLEVLQRLAPMANDAEADDQ
jgi:hypothetical protein